MGSDSASGSLKSGVAAVACVSVAILVSASLLATASLLLDQNASAVPLWYRVFHLGSFAAMIVGVPILLAVWLAGPPIHRILHQRLPTYASSAFLLIGAAVGVIPALLTWRYIWGSWAPFGMLSLIGAASGAAGAWVFERIYHPIGRHT